MHVQHGRSFYWLSLCIAIILEVIGSGIMKYTSGSPWEVQGLLTMYAMLGLSYFCLAKAALGLPIGVAYAFWEGLGLVLVTIVSVTMLAEPMTIKRAVALCLIFGGTVFVHHGTGHGAVKDPGTRDESPSDRPVKRRINTGNRSGALKGAAVATGRVVS